MQYYGDIELINSKIINCLIDPVSTLPTFSAADKSRIVYNTTDNQYYYNNGTEYVPFQVASQQAQPLINTLGSNWINNDYSFNPSPFNSLGFVTTPLASTDNLFAVFERLDTTISHLSNLKINDITGFSVANPQAGDIMYYNGTDFINSPLSQLPNFGLVISLNELSDVSVDAVPTDNEALFFNSATNKFTTYKTMYRYQQNTPQSTHVVTHNLNQLYCEVTVWDTANNAKLTPAAVIANSNAQLTVTLNSAAPVQILVRAIPV